MDSVQQRWGRWGGVAALIGGVAALLVTPVFAVSYLEPTEESPTFLIDAIRPVVEPLLGFASVDTVYRSYGLLYLVATGFMFVGFLALRAHIRRPLAERGSRGLTVAFVGWLMVLIGLAGDYGIGDALGNEIHIAAFLIEMLGVLSVLIGLLLVGIQSRRSRSLPGLVSWSLIAALPLGIVGVVLLSHLPSGPMLGINIAWVTVGLALLKENVVPARAVTASTI
jgi:hypothetical protein